MKISKSFKIYIHIIVLSLFSQNLIGAEDFSKNVVIHEKPIAIKEIKFKDSDLLTVDLTNKKGNIMIINFWATWCGPCQQFAPTFKQAASQLEPNARFIKIETEAEQTISAKYSIRSIPTLVMFKNGQEIDRVSGALSIKDLTHWIKNHT